MTRLTGRAGVVLAAFVATVALWFSAAMPGVATANESPSPPALGVLTHCRAPSRSAPSAVEGCPALVRASSSATVPSAGRKLPVGLSTPTPSVIAGGAATIVPAVVARSDAGPPPSSNGPRAPPPSGI